ncbi:MAG: hypothetical protein JHC31_05725 [Sulfurihydrogenibium sp.]|nr:hypothetical protein [Sulfurihydrogenibium sp.]
MDLHNLLALLSVVQIVATLVLIPIIKFVLDTKIQYEKERFMIEIILKEVEEIKQKIKELENG